MDKPFKTRWAIFAQSFETLDEAIDKAMLVVKRGERHRSEVVTEVSTFIPESNGSTVEETLYFECNKFLNKIARAK